MAIAETCRRGSASGPTQTEVTVYQQGFGLVKETRLLALVQGRQTVAVEEVAAQINPASVGIASLGRADAFNLHEQNYQYDLISPMAILSKSIGHRVRIGRSDEHRLAGVLMSAPVVSASRPQIDMIDGIVVRTDDGRFVLNPTGEVEVEDLPEGLISRPTLEWDLSAPEPCEVPVELSYLTRGLSWSADYVLTLDGSGTSDLQGWVTLINQCGATFENATLKLLAGDVHESSGTRGHHPQTGSYVASAGESRPMAEESLFEYHLYTLARPATIRNRESKQLALLEGHSIPVAKRLSLDFNANSPGSIPTAGEKKALDANPQVRIEFTNDHGSGLGMPLPRGRVRVCQRDSSGSLQFLGEDTIAHTPKDEKVSLVVGKAFDIVASRKRLAFSRLSDRSSRETFQIEVRNRKVTSETVFIVERHWHDWKVTDTTHEYARIDANTLEFRVDLEPDAVEQVTYTVETNT